MVEPSLMANLLNARILFVGLVICMTVVYLFTSSKSTHVDASDITRRETTMEKINWKELNLVAKKLPDVNVNNVFIEQKYFDAHGTETFIQSADPPDNVKKSNKVVLLLHGAAFTSQTWIDKVDTIRTLAALGHRVIAIDLPGYGKTKVLEREVTNNKADYLEAIIDTLTPDNIPVVVTPSMSGGFMVPFIKQSPEKVRAWIPVAPVSTSEGRLVFPNLQIPTMIVYGENDKGLGINSRNDLELIPTSTKAQVLPNSGHPAYLDQPELWHQLLFNFIESLP